MSINKKFAKNLVIDPNPPVGNDSYPVPSDSYLVPNDSYPVKRRLCFNRNVEKSVSCVGYIGIGIILTCTCIYKLLFKF
jgi:hypothetical protein